MSAPSTNGLKIIMEFVGTFILSGAINFSTQYTELGQSGSWLLIFTSFYVAITWCREISGGHINPAVTTAVYLSYDENKRSKEQSTLTLYIVAQILGALSSCLLSFIFYRENVFQIAINKRVDPMHALIAEILATGLFTYTILCQGDKNAKLTNEKSVSTFVVSMALFTTANIAGNVSGGCLNPAIGFAHNFVRLLVTGDVKECKYLWIYIAGPITGAACAAYLYNNYFSTFFTKNEEKGQMI